jgi:hypothetical protein
MAGLDLAQFDHIPSLREMILSEVTPMRRILGLAAPLRTLAFLLYPLVALAQTTGGNIYGSVTDESGAVLPGAIVTLTSTQVGTRTTTSGTNGDFRFLNVDPGRYTVAVALTGFATTKRDIVVNTGTSLNLSFGLKVATMVETVTVTEETPTVDVKKQGTATTLTSDELAKMPQGRDPWAVLNQVPGVLVDRVSIAGNEAGQQSLFVGKGAQFTDTMWTYDGIVMTDTTSYGASSQYFDFDAFNEINVTTGGNNLQVQTGGLGLNFVTKRGTNAFHGGARTFFTNHKAGEGKNVPAELEGDPRLLDGRGDQIRQINDYGFDLGGPIVKDKLWFWGSYGKNDIRLYRLTNASDDKTLLKTWNAKLNWQASSKDQVAFSFFNNSKIKIGRDPAYAGNNQALWNQGNFYAESDCGLPCGMHGLFKADWTHTFSNSFILQGKYAFFNWGYGFDPQQGGSDLSIDRVADSAKGSAEILRFLKPWHNANLDGTYFAHGLGGNHELKFGFSYRHWPNTSSGHFDGNQIVAVHNNDDPNDPTSRVAWVARAGVVKFNSNNTSLYIGDTYTAKRWTVNAGVRWDRQKAENSASTATGNDFFPELVPSLEFNGDTPGIDFKDISPRFAVTVALDEARKTVVRASYARYAGQLGPLDATYNSPVTYGYTYLAYRWADRNGDGFAQKDEILTGDGVVYTSGNIDPNNPTSLESINKIDPNYHANRDNEIIAGIEHELVPDLSIGLAYTWRKGTDTLGWSPRIDDSGRILTTADYIPLAPVTSNGFTVQPYEPDPTKIGSGGGILTNRPDYHLQYNGIELTLNKRLSHRWMTRINVAYGSWTEHFDGPDAVQNPSSTDLNAVFQGGGLNNYNESCGPCVDGGQVYLKSYGAKTNSFASAKWNASVTGLYQLGGGFEIGASFLARQGYPKVEIVQTGTGSDGSKRLLPPGGGDRTRYDNFYNLDLRVAKLFKLSNTVGLNLAVDLFNVFNSSTVLQETRRINADVFGNILEIPNPRVIRYGVRLQF